MQSAMSRRAGVHFAVTALIAVVGLCAEAPATTHATIDSAKPKHLYQSCLAVIDRFEGTGAEAASRNTCRQIRHALRVCNHQARELSERSARRLARRACGKAAHTTIQALAASSPSRR